MSDPTVIEKALKMENKEDAVFEIFKHLLLRLAEGDQSLTQPEKNFVYANKVEREAFSVGFGFFFLSPSSEYAHETLQALREIGAKAEADLLQKAIDKFPDSTVPKDFRTRINAITHIWEADEDAWGDYADRRYNSDNFLALLIEYIWNNRTEFR